jgi:hypothetical protein
MGLPFYLLIDGNNKSWVIDILRIFVPLSEEDTRIRRKAFSVILWIKMWNTKYLLLLIERRAEQTGLYSRLYINCEAERRHYQGACGGIYPLYCNTLFSLSFIKKRWKLSSRTRYVSGLQCRVVIGRKKVNWSGRSKSLSRPVRTVRFNFIHRTGPVITLVTFFDRLTDR